MKAIQLQPFELYVSSLLYANIRPTAHQLDDDLFSYLESGYGSVVADCAAARWWSRSSWNMAGSLCIDGNLDDSQVMTIRQAVDSGGLSCPASLLPRPFSEIRQSYWTARGLIFLLFK